jgi:hypothetical protein
MGMPLLKTALPLCVSMVLSIPVQAGGQTTDSVGTRAQGMGGAFVGVADDASAVYWNPAGLAGGAYFSLVLDGTAAKAVPGGGKLASDRSGRLLALTTPALGLSYYRIHTSTVTPVEAPGSSAFLLGSLTTQHVGATLVQSLTDQLAVGATVKVIRGLAGSAEVPALGAEDALDDWDVAGQSSNRIDLDVGLMVTGSAGRLGLVVRNVAEPAFETGNDGPDLRLDRQVRAGGSVLLLQNWKLAADVDFTRSRTVFGDVRELALGTEGQVTRRVAARAGVRLNTAGDQGRTPALSVGGSFAALGSVLLDAQITTGSDRVFRGWGIAGRLVF